MLESVKISRRQSEIRQALAALVGKTTPTDDETHEMESLDAEYRQNEVRYRASLIAEDDERRQAKDELETRSEKEFGELIDQFEVRQIVLALDEGRALDGATAEVVSELRETIASGTPDPVATRPIIDRLFPDSVAARMGASLINIDSGSVEWPVATQGASVGWQSTETGSVGSAQAYQTIDRPLSPDHTLGTTMKLTRKTLKQSGDALEAAVRRDMNAVMQAEMDRVVFLGSGSSGEPEGILTLAEDSPVPFTVTAVDSQADWEAIKAAVVEFMTANAANGPGSVRMLIRPETWAFMDGLPDGTLLVTEWEKLTRQIPAGNIVLTSNALDDPSGSPLATQAVLMTSAGGVAPVFVGVWGAVDLIRDPYSDAASGGLRLTALATLDLTISRGQQTAVLTGVQIA
jgi:HK97 family phage major capsid protein